MTRDQLKKVRPDEALARITPPGVTQGFDDPLEQARHDLSDEMERNGFACKWLKTASLVTLPFPLGAMVELETTPGTVGKVVGFHVQDGDRPDDPPRIDVQVLHAGNNGDPTTTYLRSHALKEAT